MTTKQCPHAKSDMTPCVLKDGQICFAMNNNDNPICVGCEKTPEQLGVPAPENWQQQVADYRARHGRKSSLVRRKLKGST